MKQGAELKVKRLVDRHVHLRNGELMNLIALYTFRQCDKAIIMPNTKPAITSIDIAREYIREIDILSHKEELQFTPHLTLYLTDNTDIKELKKGYKEDIWIAGKLYPKGVTTNSKNGITDIKNTYPVLEVMQDIGMPALFHCEMPMSSGVGFFDRERVFVDDVLSKIKEEFPELKIVIEHASTRQAIDFVIRNVNTWATITPHHLMKTYDAMFNNGFDPTYFCYTPLNSEKDRQAIISAVMSGIKGIREKFGAGTDSAPHHPKDKIKIGGNGGIFIPFPTELYTTVFEKRRALKYLDDFLAVNLLEEVYGIRPTTGMYTTLVKEEWEVSERYTYYEIRPFMAGEKLQWRIKSQIGR